LTGRLVSVTDAIVPSTSVPVSVIGIEVASSLPLADAVDATGASLTEFTVMVAVAGVASEAP
jgi:hypothetical protein